MKTRNQFLGLIAIAIIATTIALIGCDGDDKPTDNPPVPYGTLPNGVGIYKGDASITDAQMATAVQSAIAGYNSVRPEFGSPDGKFTKLVILSDGAGYTWDATTKVLSVGCDAPDGFFRMRFEAIANGSIT